MFKHDKEDSTSHNDKFESFEENLNHIWELITTVSDDVFEIKRKLGLEAELHKGKRSDLGIHNLLKIAVKQHPILHPSSIFDEVSYHIAFSDGVDTRIHTSYRLPDGGTDVFEDETKKKIFDDWVSKNKEYWVRQIRMTMGEVCGWKLFDGLKESSIKTSENEDSVKIYELMKDSPEFKKFKYRIDTQEIIYFGMMSLEEKEQCLKVSISEIDKRHIEELYRKSQSAKEKY